MSAVLVVLLLAPIVLRRVIWFTERRLRATMPLSPQEIRAQKDMARAVYAAENAKIGQDLIREREKALNIQLRNENLLKDAGRLQSENAELQMQISEMNVEAADMRSRLRREDSYADQLKGKLKDAEDIGAAKNEEIQTLNRRINKLIADIDNLKIDLAASGTMTETAQSRIASLRDERDSLRHDLKLMTQRAKDAEMRLSKEEQRALRLEERLMREQTLNADREGLLERRTQDNTRLKERLKKSSSELREANKALRIAAIEMPGISKSRKAAAKEIAVETQMHAAEANAYTSEQLAEDLRGENAALSERLRQARTPEQDEALRVEIASLAVRMVALTAMKEGSASPIHAILKTGMSTNKGNPDSLAERIAHAMTSEGASADLV
ncbi:hypothetical protein [Metarhizobium album]|uniref:hypothetical protein n=1 Tax=Metarhizobium album TaxID=2182425 RepID=UPI000FFE70AB|nr:hypothetical protein [Rhizobium album]